MPPLLAIPSAGPPVVGKNRFRITGHPPVDDPVGFAGAFAGVSQGLLIAGGGANFPDGVMPWDGGRKVWHECLFALDLRAPESGWKPAGKLPARNGYGVSLTVDEGILIIGGSDESRHFREVHLLRLDDRQRAIFRPLPALPEPLAQMCGAAVGRRIHICGGISSPTSATASNKHWTLDLDAPACCWVEAPPLPGPGRILATAAAVGGRFVMAGGCSLEPDRAGAIRRTYLRDAWCFSDRRWTPLAEMPRGSVAAASPAPVAGDSLFIVSGDDGGQSGLASPGHHRGFTTEVLRCDVVANRWTSEGDLCIPAPVTLPTAPWNGGCIFFNGEIKPGVRTPQVFHFEPIP